MRFPHVLRAALVSAFALPAAVAAADAVTGPVIEGFGPVYAAPADAWNLEAGRLHRVSMDVAAAPGDVSAVNRHIESAARFLNMNARAGVPASDIDFAVVLHGQAARAALTDEAYESRHGVPNPDGALVEALAGAGVRFYLCWQSAAHAGFDAGAIRPEVTIAVSAMSAHVRLQEEGFTLIPF